MRLKITFLCAMIFVVIQNDMLFAQSSTDTLNTKYRRSSIYSMLIQQPYRKYQKEITDVFYSIPIPDRFDSHDLNLKVINATGKKKKDVNKNVIQTFLDSNAVGRRLVAKWYGRDLATGVFDPSLMLLTERGYYNASFSDIKQAEHTLRGISSLGDQGFELVGNTFIVVNDIRYVDQSAGWKIAAAVVAIAGATAGAVAGGSAGTDLMKSTSDLGESLSQFDGFKVEVTSYLFRLEWNEETEAIFNTQYWTPTYDAVKKAAFENDKTTFKLKYIGSETVKSSKTTTENIGTKEGKITKVCARSIDKSLVKLQKSHDEFRVKTPVYSTDPIQAKIGMKEGVNNKSRFEVLEMEEDEQGKIVYKRMAVIKPKKGKIWDNRFGAEDEKKNKEALLGSTEFTKVGAGKVEEGMLIREAGKSSGIKKKWFGAGISYFGVTWNKEGRGYAIDLNFRGQYYFTPNWRWDFAVLRVAPGFGRERANFSMAGQIMTGVHYVSKPLVPNFKKVIKFPVFGNFRLGYGGGFTPGNIDDEGSGFCFELEGGVKFTKWLSLGLVYNNYTIIGSEEYTMFGSYERNKSNASYFGLRVGFEF